MTDQEQMCVRCVMDTTDSEIQFDEFKVCNHCRELESVRDTLTERRSGEELNRVVDMIREAGRKRKYDCIVGVSGGVDSSYLLHLAVTLGLRPLPIHFDNGWDSELAVSNIHSLVNGLDLELVTHIVDWVEFRELQLAYLRSGVVDIEVLTDHAITALIYKLAKDEKLRFSLSGNNWSTESVMPRSWNYRKSDLRNLKHIVRSNDGPRIRTLPMASTLRLAGLQYLSGLRSIDLLNYVDYDRNAAIATLSENYGWRDYGGKHFESVFTRYYQAHILPTKFSIDKRRAHLSSMILSGQMSREDAFSELTEPLYDSDQLREDHSYVAKKLNISVGELDRILAAPPRRHDEFRSDAAYAIPVQNIIQRLLRARARLRTVIDR